MGIKGGDSGEPGRTEGMTVMLHKAEKERDTWQGEENRDPAGQPALYG